MRQIWICLFLICTGLGAAPIQVEVSAKAALLMNAESGRILYEKEANTIIFPASTTKIATALFLLEEKQPDLHRVVSVSREALRQKHNGASEPAHWITADSSLMGLQKGDRFPLEDLLHGLLMASGNDAANVLAETVSGSVPHFMQELNAYFQKIGCPNTRFVNPHGLHHPDHVTTAYELALITQKALQIPKFREVVGKLVYRTSGPHELELKQSNKLLRPGEYYYPKAIGVKTGYHGLAQSNLVAAAVDGGRTLIAVVLGCPKKDDRFRDAKLLFEAAFAEKKVDAVLVAPSEVYKKSVEGAASELTASVAEPLAISFYPAETPKVKGFINWSEIRLPVQMGQKVGEIRVLDERGVELGCKNLVAQNKVSPTFLFRLKSFWKRLFAK